MTLKAGLRVLLKIKGRVVDVEIADHFCHILSPANRTYSLLGLTSGIEVVEVLGSGRPDSPK